jgi:hypothetical protein
VAIPVPVTAAAVFTGVLGCWGLFRAPALEMLRAEARADVEKRGREKFTSSELENCQLAIIVGS